MRSRASTADSLRIALAAVAWSGVLLQLWLTIRLGKSLLHAMVIYFGYFTIFTNIFVALVCTLPSLGINRRFAAWLDSAEVTGCATSAILLAGIGYHLRLREVWSPQGVQWFADVVLHYVVPAGMLAYWLLSPRRKSNDWSLPLKWTACPFIYLGYALVRGEMIGAYPYPFLDVSVIGYRQALLEACGLLAVSVLLGFAVLGLACLRPKASPESRG